MPEQLTMEPAPQLWVVQPAADALVHRLVADVLNRCPDGARLADRLLVGAGVRLIDLLDHIVVGDSVALRDELLCAGFVISGAAPATASHGGGIFPEIVLRQEPGTSLALTVESVLDFILAHELVAEVDGVAGGTYRRARVYVGDEADVWVVERRGHAGFDLPLHSPREVSAAAAHLESFRARRRLFDNPADGFDHVARLVRDAIADLGTNWTCALFLRAERDYWEARNSAARVQKARQDALGIGWANDDHHTYDTSREWFRRTIDVLELLGFVCRERFYAGAEAGWGSQILEQPVLGAVIFADIDLAPDELTGDFAHADLRPLPALRRAGLWCALHGESMLEAGLNHLECTYDSAALRTQLHRLGVELMTPFSNFPHLYQQLTVGEWWPVRAERLEWLLRNKLITPEQAAAFAERGAVGSHLENLERNQGYKGFNQPGISSVLRIIDPREFV
jgi:hypothetical protein